MLAVVSAVYTTSSRSCRCCRALLPLGERCWPRTAQPCTAVCIQLCPNVGTAVRVQWYVYSCACTAVRVQLCVYSYVQLCVYSCVPTLVQLCVYSGMCTAVRVQRYVYKYLSFLHQVIQRVVVTPVVRAIIDHAFVHLTGAGE